MSETLNKVQSVFLAKTTCSHASIWVHFLGNSEDIDNYLQKHSTSRFTDCTLYIPHLINNFHLLTKIDFSINPTSKFKNHDVRLTYIWNTIPSAKCIYHIIMIYTEIKVFPWEYTGTVQKETYHDWSPTRGCTTLTVVPNNFFPVLDILLLSFAYRVANTTTLNTKRILKISWTIKKLLSTTVRVVHHHVGDQSWYVSFCTVFTLM